MENKSPSINCEELLEGLPNSKGDRKATTVYLSEALYLDFRKACGEITPSKVLERLMQSFIKGKEVTNVSKKQK